MSLPVQDGDAAADPDVEDGQDDDRGQAGGCQWVQLKDSVRYIKRDLSDSLAVHQCLRSEGPWVKDRAAVYKLRWSCAEFLFLQVGETGAFAY